MEDKILFKERQKFNQWWLWLILLTINGVFLISLYRQLILGHETGSNPISDTGLIIVTGCFLLFTLIFANIRLDTIIKNDGIYVQFFPFHFRFKHFTWESLSKSHLRTYSPLKEYGGWGIRIGLFGIGMAYNISGKDGLQLVFKNNKKLLIGTNKIDELTETLIQLGQLKK